MIQCPHCGYTGCLPGDPDANLHDEPGSSQCVGFYLIEDIEAYRFVTGTSPGKIVVYSLYATGEGYDEGEGTFRLECRKCMKQFPLPEGLEIEWD